MLSNIAHMNWEALYLKGEGEIEGNVNVAVP